MKKITLIILAVIICFPAIAKHKKHKKKQESGNEIISVQIFRTGCYGKCPTYTVEINNDGMATYTAIRFNADSGVFKKNIGKAKAMEILNEVNSYKPDTCKDVYDARAADLPGINFNIKYKNKTKTIDRKSVV